MKTSIHTAVVVFLVPAAALGAEEGVNVVPDDVGLWIWTLGAFLVMFALLSRFALKPIAEALDRRAKTIQQSLTDAEKQREDAKKLLADYEKRIAEARGEAAKLIEEARAMGENVRKEVLDKAKTETTAMVQRAQEEIERQKDKGLQDMKEAVATLAVEIAAKVLEKEVSAAAHRDLVEGLVRDLGKIPKAS